MGVLSTKSIISYCSYEPYQFYLRLRKFWASASQMASQMLFFFAFYNPNPHYLKKAYG